MSAAERAAPADPDGQDLQSVIDRLTANVAMIDQDGRVTAVNAAWVRFASENGDPGDAAIGVGADYLAACDTSASAADGDVAARAVSGIRSVLRGQASEFTLEYPCHPPGAERWFVVLVAPLSRGGAVVTHVDVTEERRAMDDPLRGTPSRALVEGQVEIAIAAAHQPGEEVAVLYVDVDDFKEVNDTLGHSVGDALLEGVAARLKDVVKSGGTVRRLASDEYIAVLPGASRVEAERVATHIAQALRAPFEIGPDTVLATVSIGIARYPDDARAAQELVRCADAAMAECKRSGRDTWRFFDDDLAARRTRRLQLSRGLRGALAGEQFTLRYQPQLALADRRVVGVEALLRWRCPPLGDPSPSEFIPVAESTGRILPIGRWVLSESIKQMAQWQEAGLTTGVLAVNVSGRHLSQPGFTEEVLDLLSEFDLPAELLELELTEHVGIRQWDLSIRVMRRLCAAGVRFAIDDFGCGYSSLANLAGLPLHKAKIDRSFIAALDHDERVRALVRSMVPLIRSMGLTCVAEGVQTEEQAAFLSGIECDAVQGFRYASPMAAEELVAWLSPTR
jgi:diguanylate cyclase (GGDEF)-like protein